MSTALKLPHNSLKAASLPIRGFARLCTRLHGRRRCKVVAFATAAPESTTEEATEQALPSNDEPKVPATKLCTCCGKVKGQDHFPRHGRSKDGLQSWCLECKIEEMRAQLPGQPVTDEKRCRICGKLKPLSAFTKNRANPTGVDPKCRDCTTEMMRRNTRANQEKHRLLGAPSAEGKVCTACKVYKPASDFYRSLSYSTGLYSRCKECVSLSVSQSRPKKERPPGEHIAVTEKLCKKCDALQPASAFAYNRATVDGLQSYCRNCFKRIAKERQQEKEARERLLPRKVRVRKTKAEATD